VIKKGCSFHHAGLMAKQKNIIEENFRKGLIKAIVATPTLAMGINLPAFRVVIRDVKRYSSGLGSTFIPVMEYKQFAGRAGRPQYDEFGESVIMAKSELEAYDLVERYIKASPENIESKLAQEVALRTHLLSLISSGIISNKQSIIDFFNSTFFSFQYQDVNLLEEKIVKVISSLLEWKFIDKNPHGYFATELGRRISQLYLDPLTANNFISALENLLLVQDIKMLSVLQAISYSSEMHPLLSIKSKDHLILNEIINLMRDNFLMPVPAMYEEEYDEFLSSLKTALVLESWTEEETEDVMLDRFQITPGELHAKLEIAEWLMYCSMEITKILNHKELIKELKKIRICLIYGVKEELLELVSLREIGRVRARRLFDKGIKNLVTLRNVPDNKLSLILGPKVSKIVKEQLTKVTSESKYAKI
ncbi:MAG: helicase-related protein, partial [Candidatus Omnitrophota bacterium]